jgi:riboflavin-specific deaminase-like protein
VTNLVAHFFPTHRTYLMPTLNRPFVLLNMAMSADGKIATANRVIASFGSARDQAHLLELRATADAVITGASTANLPGITLGPGGLRYQRLRLRRQLSEFNLRVVVSGNAHLEPHAAVFSETRSPLVVLVSGKAPVSRVRRLEQAGAVVGRFGKGRVDLVSALVWLRDRWGVRRLVCEGGSTLNDSMFRAGLIDEVHVTVCPLLFGGGLAPTITDGQGFPNLSAAVGLEWTRTRRVGNELFATLRVGGAPPPPTTPPNPPHSRTA